MSALIDVDQLRTFIAIVETGSFTKAAEVVHKTQSAVSMQMKRLEERLGKPIFARDGRASKLTEDGDRLLDYARRIIKLNVEALAAFDDKELHRPRAARPAGRLRRPLSAGDHGAVLARLSGRRADRDCASRRSNWSSASTPTNSISRSSPIAARRARRRCSAASGCCG